MNDKVSVAGLGEIIIWRDLSIIDMQIILHPAQSTYQGISVKSTA